MVRDCGHHSQRATTGHSIVSSLLPQTGCSARKPASAVDNEHF